MTRKDYELIAEVFRVNRPRVGTANYVHWLVLVGDMMINLRQTNPRFDTKKFEAACMKEKK